MREHKVKIDYSVLREFLEIIINADGTYQDDYGDYGFYREHFSISKDIKKKAKNILENS